MDYAELHCKTNFSFLEGASHAHELVERAVALGYAALAVTDRNTLAGVVRAHAAAREQPIPLIIGAEITPQDAPPIVLWATDRAAYGRLARLITLGRRRALKGECELTFDDVAQHAQGLLAGLVTTALRDLEHDRRVAPSSLPSSQDCSGSTRSFAPELCPPRATLARHAEAVSGSVRGSGLSAGRVAAWSGRSAAAGRLDRAITRQRHSVGGFRQRALSRSRSPALA